MRPQTVTDEEILSVARKVFLEQGIQVSVQQIANELGVSQPALFKRFGNKKNLIIAAMKPPEIIPWFAHANAGPDERPFEEQLQELIMEIISFFQDVRPLLVLLEQSSIAPIEVIKDMDTPPPMVALKTLTRWLERCCEQKLIKKYDFRVVAMSLMGVLHLDNLVLPMFSTPDDSLPLLHKQENIKTIIRLFCEGLKYEE